MTLGKERDRFRLACIRECIDRIRTYASEGRESFFRSRMVQDAVVYNLQTLAGLTQRLSDALKSGEPGGPWKNMAELHDELANNYLALDRELIWRAVENDLPVLESAVEQMSQGLASTKESPSGPPEAGI